ncbi:MAG: leucine-rich repeat protein [Lachnospiraceae bacterium]|nr:leucine-rich repeat protein [Lachnospiraceae bacterium]
MRKQRVLALLLAFSLAVSTNGMTVLAAGSDHSGISAAVEDNGSSIAEGITDAQTSEGETAPSGSENGGQTTEDETNDSVGENQSGQENSGESAGSDQNGEENPGDTAEDDQSGQENSGDTTGDDQNDPANPEDSTGDDQNDSENPSGSEEENPSDEEELNSDDTEEAGDLSGEAAVEEADEKEDNLAMVQSLAPRMMSFQDEVGMRITYDANEQYVYTVDESGTLTAITKTDGSKVAGNVVLDETQGIKRIASGAFQGNKGITYIKMPAGVVTIGANAFEGCTSLKGMTIPTGVTAIEESAFEGCSALTQFALPATIENIGNSAFYGDSRLFMVYMQSIDRSVLNSIGDNAFNGCSALEEFCSNMIFTFPESLTSIGEYAFNGCRAVKSIVFPKNISMMGAYAFASCSELREITLPQALTAIPRYGFADCRSLVSVEILSVNKTKTVGAYAFKGCYNLGSINLRLVSLIEQYAFVDCSGLIRVQITEADCLIEEGALPEVKRLYLIGVAGGKVEEHAVKHNDYITFVSIEDETEEGKTLYYQCSVQEPLLGTGKGEIKLTTEKPNGTADPVIKDPNKENGGKGVEAGTTIYVIPKWNAQESNLISIKYNGIEIKSKDYIWSFIMPKGGARVTAEFENISGSSAINGTDVTVEFSNGSDGESRAELKVGQTTRIFLLDGDHNVIPTSKIDFSSDKPTIAKVDEKTGMITALKEGLAHINIKVTGGNGPIPKQVTIHVTKTNVESLLLTVDDNDERFITITEEEIGGQAVQIASLDSKIVSQNERAVKLKALAYDADLDEMSVALKWTTSDSSVARLASSSTANAVTTNTVTIPKGANGEATITVSATNADKKTISRKLIIQVIDQTPRLSTTSITLNPNKVDGAVIRVISAYGGTIINPDTIELVDAANEQLPVDDFKCERDKLSSTDTVHYYTINPRYTTLEEKVYNVKVKVGDRVIPTQLKITVKSTLPNPKVAFDKKQPKINLFYANDGTEVKPVVTNLGNEKVSRYTLEPLSTDREKDDWLFTENFQIDEDTGVITQKEDQMILTEKNKLIATGYLVLHFEGYKESAVKKYKITIPTQTVKPSYKLDRTSDTFNSLPAARTIKLTLIDTKTKEQIRLDEGDWTIEKSSESRVDAVNRDIDINDQGQIEMHTDANSTLSSGKVVLLLRNSEWAEGQSFKYTYNVKATGADPKIKLKTATVNLNSNYTGQEEKFYLTSNQCDTELADSQDFYFQSTTKNENQREYLHVEYNGGVGTVSVDPDVKAGSYKFKCDSVEGINGERYNAVTLTVKVVNTLPGMTVKGSPSLNLSAVSDGEYTETAELTLNVKLPEGYEIDSAGTIDSIECTTKGMSAVKDSFNWDIEENILLISLNSRVSQQKYAFTMTPTYIGANTFQGKAVKFSVKVYNGSISVKMSPKGVLNLVDRSGEYTLKNSIVYTPSFTNLKDTVEAVQIFDAGGREPALGDDESEYFRAEVLDGKVYVAPRDGVDLENKKTYPIRMWVRLANYGGYDGMWVPGILNIKTAQVLPKVTADRNDLNLYMSNKAYEATFRVTPKEGSVGNIADVVFGEKDTKSQDSFEIRCGEPREDGSIDVYVKLKNTVSFAGGTTNKITMYAMFDGQGTNTVGPAITMNVKINK